MDKASDEVIDSQIIAENVGFLDNWFDHSFAVQSSLKVVKEYFTEENKHDKTVSKKRITILNKSLSLDTTIITQKTSQIVKQKVYSKSLKAWGLPAEISRKYQERGISEMFDWQVTCLTNSKVLLDSCNLVYSAPTSAGKTLVAEILTIKTILERQKKVIIILPFVSIVREKMFYLQDILASSGIRVEGFMGSQSPPGGLQAVHVAICTIEKANSLLNRLLDEDNISDLGAVIVDELHLLGDPNRGYILELLLTKIKYITLKHADIKIQIVGMSATLPNLSTLANWLQAELYVTQFRPIPLDEYCLVGKKLYDKDGNYLSTMNAKTPLESDHVLNICLETIKEGCSVLIFCMTKNRCENLAQSIAQSFYSIGCQQGEFSSILRSQLNTEKISEVLEQLRNCPVGLDQVLKTTVSFGVAYHHAGLTFDERDIIEGGFKSGALRILVATSTLSSGVNLPARKVIVRTPVFQRQPINIMTYKQMIGRAGRMGKDTKGESILICTENEKNIGFDLMKGALDPVKSCIETEDKYMRAVLEMIASQVVSTKEELDLYSKCTLLYTQNDVSASQNQLLENTLKELKNFELIRLQEEDDVVKYIATSLGKACLSASIAPNDGLSLFLELQKARQCLVLETDLHLIYLVTPYSVSSQWADIDWLHLLSLWESMTKAMQRVGELVGVQESFIIRCLRGNKSRCSLEKLNVHKRFYTALALQDLVNEVPLSDVAAKFQCARGFLQSLQQAAATFAGMVTAFCHQLGWKNMEILISQFQDRLHFGIHSELLDLMKLPSLNGVRARALFDAGYENVSSVASADTNVIENILHKAVPFQSEKEREGDDKDDLKKRNKIRSIWITGCCGKTPKEAAENLIGEARKYIQSEIGTEVKWDAKETNTSSVSQNVDTEVKEDIESNSNEETNQPIDHEVSCNADNKIENKTIDTQLPINNRISIDLLDTSTEDINVSVNFSNFITHIKDETKNHSQINDNNEEKGIKLKIIDNPAKTQIKTIAIPTLSPDVTFDSPPIVKDELEWESLNFTDTAIGHLSKVSTVNKTYSPNISFGETERSNTSIKNTDVKENKSNQETSVKDVSIFSTEGDESSLFEESLPLDLIPSNLLETRVHTLTQYKRETTVDFENLNTDSIINVFQSSLLEADKSVDKKINKLQFPKDKSDSNKAKESPVNENEVICSQQDIVTVTNFKSPCQRRRIHDMGNKHHQPKRIKLGDEILKENSYNVLDKLRTKDVQYKVKIDNHCINCVVLKGTDVKEKNELLKKIDTASIYLVIKQQNLATNNVIGSDILNIERNFDKTNEICIKGIAIYLEYGTCFYIDTASLKIIEMNLLRSFFLKDKLLLIMHSLKMNYVCLKKWLGICLPNSSSDVAISDWLINSGERVMKIEDLTKQYCKINLPTVKIEVNSERTTFKKLDVTIDACVKAWCIWNVAGKQKTFLSAQYGVSTKIIDRENHIATILGESEHTGIMVDKNLASFMLTEVKRVQEFLQKKGDTLAGCNVNFSSPKCVAKILGMHSIGKVSTKKSVLSCHTSPLASVVIYWRKLNCILTKILYPLAERAVIYTQGNRITPTYSTYTCTGRITMHDPNLQSIPRTFTIPPNFIEQRTKLDFNCRSIFKASPGYIIVSADYCQLEMRVLTHFSEDEVLVNIMRRNVDVFKSIAASWSGVSEAEVDDDLRQKAKQLCYGILYGMGNKTLSQHLDVTELDAAFFMDSFFKTFPRIKPYTQRVIEECRKRGYVETLMKRRRYLNDVKSNIPGLRGTAERQAVNTTIQGSAADIAKAAMCDIDIQTNTLTHKPRLLLQMHDELIYEVKEQYKDGFVKIMKSVMEGTVKLKVPLPVKVRCGYSWGKLDEVKL